MPEDTDTQVVESVPTFRDRLNSFTDKTYLLRNFGRDEQAKQEVLIQLLIAEVLVSIHEQGEFHVGSALDNKSRKK
jgi:hypothetical protein